MKHIQHTTTKRHQDKRDMHEQDVRFMARALELAKRGTGKVSPNPRVGCVIVKDGEIIGEGWHREYGLPHAEVEAFLSAKSDVDGATWYVTLEPCAHHGKTPPCVDLLLSLNPARVVIAMIDPHEKVAGKGVAKLREAGVEVVVGVLEQEARWLNRTFIKHITTGLPYVVLKAGMSIDGCLATANGQSKWITGKESLRFAHELRAELDAILVGEYTVLKDDPSLTVRHVEGRNPKRIVLDSDLTLPLKAKVFMSEERRDTIVFCSEKTAIVRKAESLRVAGVMVRGVAQSEQHRLDLGEILRIVSDEMNIASVLVEGGAQVISSFVARGLFDEIHLFMAPKIIGNGMHVFGGVLTPTLETMRRTKVHSLHMLGEDIHLVLLPEKD